MKKYILIFGIILIAVSFLTYCYYPVKNYVEKNKPGRIYFEDRNGTVITDKANKYGYKLTDKKYDLNSEFIKSLLIIEDKNYYNHYGVDIISKIGALITNIKSSEILSGGSTITEQYIKNKYFKENKRTYLQKSREAFISIYFSLFPKGSLSRSMWRYPQGEGLEKKVHDYEKLGIFIHNKNIILNNYLNDLYLANNIYGLNSAIKVYFDKNDLKELTKEEIVLLISLIHNPGVKDINNKEFKNYFLKVKNKLDYEFKRKIYKLNKKKNIDIFPHVTNNTDILKLEKQKLSIDYNLQKFSKEILNQTLDELKEKNVTNGAIFAIDPKTNQVLIYQASRDFYSEEIDGQVDVINSNRQPGSTMKPFLYLKALELGYNPDNLLIDIESEYNSFKDNSSYISENYSLNEYGLVRLKKALGNSLNNASVRLAKELGLNNVYDFYKQYGFTFNNNAEHYGYSLVLGNPDIKLKDLVYSYANLLDFENDNKFLLYNILSDPDNRDISFGVNSILNTSIAQAVKTGTTTDFRDNLVISYHNDLVIGVWVGNNDNSSMKGVTGITGAGYIWHQIVEKAIELGYIHDRNINTPIGVEESEYCLDEKCYRKELIYHKKGVEYFSRIKDDFYSKDDILERPSQYEIDKLEELKFYIK